MASPFKPPDFDAFRLCALECQLMAAASRNGNGDAWRLAALALEAAIRAEPENSASKWEDGNNKEPI